MSVGVSVGVSVSGWGLECRCECVGGGVATNLVMHISMRTRVVG